MGQGLSSKIIGENDTLISEEKDQNQDNRAQNGVTRRQAVKTLAGAAAVIAAMPAVGSMAVSSMANQSNQSMESATFQSSEEPFVILVGKDELRGFRGEKEYSVRDSALTQKILGAFSGSESI